MESLQLRTAITTFLPQLSVGALASPGADAAMSKKSPLFVTSGQPAGSLDGNVTKGCDRSLAASRQSVSDFEQLGVSQRCFRLSCLR